MTEIHYLTVAEEFSHERLWPVSGRRYRADSGWALKARGEQSRLLTPSKPDPGKGVFRIGGKHSDGTIQTQGLRRRKQSFFKLPSLWEP